MLKSFIIVLHCDCVTICVFGEARVVRIEWQMVSSAVILELRWCTSGFQGWYMKTKVCSWCVNMLHVLVNTHIISIAATYQVVIACTANKRRRKKDHKSSRFHWMTITCNGHRIQLMRFYHLPSTDIFNPNLFQMCFWKIKTKKQTMPNEELPIS